MPKDKDFKRRVRARMARTGESYTTARAHLLKRSPTPLPDDHESVAGMSDAAVADATGRDWSGWVRLLDEAGAADLPHADIARRVEQEHGLSGWWAQTVTVGYERLRGLRDVGQRRDGSYEVSRSRTLPVPLAELYGAFADETRREAWLPGVALEIRTLNEEKNARTAWSDGTRVELRWTEKGGDRSTVTVQHRGLPDPEAREARRLWWGERLDALADLLARGG